MPLYTGSMNMKKIILQGPIAKRLTALSFREDIKASLKRVKVLHTEKYFDFILGLRGFLKLDWMHFPL